MILIFSLWTFYLYVATFQQHLYISVSMISSTYGILLWFHWESLLTRKLPTESRFLLVKLKLSLRKFHGHHQNFVSLYGILMQQITFLFCLSFSQSCLFPSRDLSHLSRAMRQVRLVEQELFTFWITRVQPRFLCVSFCSIFSSFYSVLWIVVCHFVFFSFSHCIVCPSI